MTPRWSYHMQGHAQKYVERYSEWVKKTTAKLYKVSTPCLDDHQFKNEELETVGELSAVCAQIVLKCLYVACIGRPDISRIVTYLARHVTKWKRAGDKRLARLISYVCSSHCNLQTILSRWEQSKWLQIRLVPRRRFRWILDRLFIEHFREPNFSANFIAKNRICSNIFRRWSESAMIICVDFVGSCDWSSGNPSSAQQGQQSCSFVFSKDKYEAVIRMISRAAVRTCVMLLERIVLI